MSATVLSPSAPPDLLREPAVALPTLVRVELRKMADTRAGRWLLGIIALLIVGTTVLFGVFADADELTFDGFLRVVQFPVGVLLPVLGILSVTSEWSQRTALTTFTLVPVRLRVVAAKAIAVVGLAVAAVLVSVLVAAIANAFPGGDGDWAFGAGTLAEVLVLQVAGMLMGLAFGLAILASAPAIVVYFALPTAWGILTSIVSGLQDPARWLDTGRAYEPLFEGGVVAVEWARIATATGTWVLVPLLFGLYRLSRSEVK